ncbi:MAG: rod shape-determining protein MreC [Chloroflexi bacterium]|nr:MAG: rod shape-determining protein MreC [Chloroflexota bacterium]
MRDRSSVRSRSGGRGNTLVVAVLIFLAVLFFLLDFQGVMTPVRSMISSYIAPTLGRTQGTIARLGDIFTGSMDVQRITTERDALAKENSDLKGQIIRIPQLELENLRLREQLRIEKENPWRLVGADISVQTLAEGRRTAIIGVGTNQGIMVGMAVISRYQSSPPALVGVVDQVGPNSANVLLVSDYSSLVSVQIYHGDTVIRGVASGLMERDAMLHMTEIEREGQIVVGDSVVTAGLTRLFGPSLPNSAIPADIPVGIVKSVGLEGRNKVAEIQPYIDPEVVRYVWIIQSDVK